ncbi:MAG: bifunctional precorrin-2 dehydrogenase/sirohydrochlorin ferrochelatase, partial [Deltaproteobacteria bacterium]
MKAPDPLDATRRPPGLLVALRLDGRTALVVGGGTVAAGRVGLLLEAGAEVTVVAPHLSTALSERVARQELRWIARAARAADLDGHPVVLIAIDDPERSAELAQAARARGALVNVADAPALCDFVLPAVFRDGALEVAVTTAGAAPGLAARLRDELASHLPADLPGALRRYASLRRTLRVYLSGTEHRTWRMRLLAGLARSATWRALASMDVAATARWALALRRRGVRAGAAVRALMGSHAQAAPARPVVRQSGPRPGEVWLAGAGLGAPALLTG